MMEEEIICRHELDREEERFRSIFFLTVAYRATVFQTTNVSLRDKQCG